MEVINHIALVVKDVSKSKDFYKKVFSFPEKKRLTAGISANAGAWFQVGALELHLQEREEDLKKTDQHLALETTRFDEIQKRVIDAGGRIEEAKLIEGFSKRCFLYDIDQNRIELLQK